MVARMAREQKKDECMGHPGRTAREGGFAPPDSDPEYTGIKKEVMDPGRHRTGFKEKIDCPSGFSAGILFHRIRSISKSFFLQCPMVTKMTLLIFPVRKALLC
ncbi:MAG: hypothetical protein WC294_07195 [Methanoregula sp.]|jgi:hypothetical protein